MLILVVDDLPDTRDVMRLLLEMKGHSVVEASNGAEGVEAALRHRPDLILMDLSMPVMDGFSATRQIRAYDPTIPIVALSAGVDEPASRHEAMQSGCTDCYSKPLDFDSLDGLLAGLHAASRSEIVPSSQN